MNVTNIYGLDDGPLRIDVFEAILEHAVLPQVQGKSNRYLENLLSYDKDGTCVSYKIVPSGKVHWMIKSGRWCREPIRQGTSLVALLRFRFNLPYLDALATLAKIRGMHYENLYQLTSAKHTAELNGGSSTKDIPEILHLVHLPAGKAYAELVQMENILGNAGQVISAVAMYSLDNRTFCLPASVGRGELSIGHYRAPAHLLNQHLLDEHPNAAIVFCQDMRTALALQRLLDETRGYDPAEVIVTAHLGEDLSVVFWNYLYNHDVVFVCAPTKRCMSMVKDYEANVRGAGAKNFRVHLGFLLHSPAGCDLTCTVEGVAKPESKLLHLAKFLDDETQPIALLRRVIKDAVSYAEYKDWGQNIGIFKSHKTMAGSTTTTGILALPEPNPLLMPPLAFVLSEATLYHAIRPGIYGMLLGAKGAGKTQLILFICYVLLKGYTRWPLLAEQAVDVGNIAYVDAETPYDEYCLNLRQHNLADELGHRFFGLNKFAPDLPTFCDCFSLTDENFREGLFHYLIEHQCRFVFLDNLAALMGDMVDHGKSAQNVLEWIEKLQKAGLCVVFVHHKVRYETASPNMDKARGSQLFSIRARTIIAMQGKTEILDNRLGTESVQEKAKLDGLTVGLRFSACKTAPVLEHKVLWLHLPLGATQWEFLAFTGLNGEEIEFPNEQQCGPEPQPAGAAHATFSPDNETDGIPHSSELLTGCTDDECKVYDFIRERGSIQNADVQKLLNRKGTKVGGIFNSLIDKKLIKRGGSGPATRYSVM